MQLFCDGSQLNHLHVPLRDFLNDHLLHGSQATEENINRGIDEVVSELNTHITAASVSNSLRIIYRSVISGFFERPKF